MRQVLSLSLLSSRSYSVFMLLFGPLLFAGLFLPTPVDASTNQCPGTTDHWYSPVSENLADKAPSPCETCDHPDNRQNPACIVARMLASEDCVDGRCGNEHGDMWLDADNGIAIQRSLRFQKPWKFLLDAGQNCWFLLWALEPVVGVEHAGAREQRDYWRLAYEAAGEWIDPPIPDAELAIMIQPAHRRSQHQLHLHIGRLDQTYRQAIDALPATSGQVHAFELDGLALRAIYVPDQTQEESSPSWSVFDVVQSMVPGGASMMPRMGILLARSTDGKGSWVLAAEGMTRMIMQLSAKQDCKLNLPR